MHCSIQTNENNTKTTERELPDFSPENQTLIEASQEYPHLLSSYDPLPMVGPSYSEEL